MRDRKRQPSAPSREEPPEVEQLRKQVEYLRALVHTDELTGLSNLRHFNETLSLELERTRRTNQPTCLILLDLDNFKTVNDNHGHEVGNSVLCHFAKVIRQTIRRLDTPCRLGGDEFAIILPATNLEQGTALTKRLRSLVRRSPFEMGSLRIQISASMGFGVYKAGDSGVSERDFFTGVDQLLYASKRNSPDSIAIPHTGP